LKTVMPDPRDHPADAPPTSATEAHPDLAAVSAMLKEAGLATPPLGDVHATRAYLRWINALTGRGSVPLAEEPRVSYRVNDRDVPCKLYWPEGARRAPLMFYCHGGGFRHGELEGWDAPLRQVVRDSGAAVLSIGYALSPEHRFPTAFEEVVAIIWLVITKREVLGRPVDGFAAGGDSAGANLVLGAAVALRDMDVRALRHLMLLYGVYSKDVESPAWRRLGGYGGRGLSAASMALYWSTYLGDDEDDWRVQPLHADLAGLPPTSVVVGDLDPLIDENVALAEKLTAAGVAATLKVLPSIIHGVVRFNEVAPVVRDLIRAESRSLRQAFLGL
jgi:acetyl esterase